MKLKRETSTLKGLLLNVIIVFSLGGLLSFIFFYKIVPWLTNKDKVVTVPDLTGIPFEQAVEFVKDRELELIVTDSSFDASVAPLVVLDQLPKANSKVKANRKINLKLNARIPATVIFPGLTGATFEFAQKQLRNLDLGIDKIEYRVDIAHNSILESRIQGRKINKGEKISKGSKIQLVVGYSSDKFPFPDLKDMPLSEAEVFILGLNLKIKEVHYTTGDGETGTVQQQLPIAGDTIRIGDEVELWVLRN